MHARRISETFLQKLWIYEDKDLTPLLLLYTCLAFGRRRKRHLDVSYMEDVDELSGMDIGSLNRLVARSECFLE